jgi:copper(I)-binding protein
VLVVPQAAQSLAASDGWVKLPADGASATAAFVTLTNPAMYDAYVVGVSSEAAGDAQLRQSAADPKPIKELTVPAYDKVEMTPSGVHIWLSQLKRPLKAGESITLSLATDGGALQVSAVVR